VPDDGGVRERRGNSSGIESLSLPRLELGLEPGLDVFKSALSATLAPCSGLW
jgi:hypothetical protein